MPRTLADHLATAEKSLATIRTIRRNLRLGRYNGRNSQATSEHLDAQQSKIDRALEAIRANVSEDEYRTLLGAFTSAFKLAERISENRDAGIDRPELRARLAADRRRYRKVVS